MRFAIYVLHAVLMVPAIAGAQADNSSYISPGGATVDELVKRALDSEPGLRAARQELEAARARVVQAGLRPNPMFSLTREQDAQRPDNENMAMLEWPLDARRRGARVAAAQAAATVSQLELADRAQELAAEVRAAAGMLLGAERELRVSLSLLDTMQRFSDLVEARTREGAAPRLDLDLALIELRRMEIEVLRARGRADQAQIALARAMGLPAGARPSLRDRIEDVSVDVSRETAIAAAKDRPDVAAAVARVELAGARTTLARREGGWDGSLVASYSYMDAGFPLFGLDAGGAMRPIDMVSHNVTAGLRLMLPWRNRNQGEVRAAEAERVAAEAEHQRVTIAAEAEILVAQIGSRVSREAVDAYARGVRDLALKTVATMRESYELGLTPLTDVLMQQRRLLEIEGEFTELLLERYQAQVELRRALRTTP